MATIDYSTKPNPITESSSSSSEIVATTKQTLTSDGNKNICMNNNSSISTNSNFNNNSKNICNNNSNQNNLIEPSRKMNFSTAPSDNDNNNNTSNMQEIYRPTYGAYLYNSLPRGPYLQYKIKDQQMMQSNSLKKHQEIISNDNNKNDNKSRLLLQKDDHNHQQTLQNIAFTEKNLTNQLNMANTTKSIESLTISKTKEQTSTSDTLLKESNQIKISNDDTATKIPISNQAFNLMSKSEFSSLPRNIENRVLSLKNNPKNVPVRLKSYYNDSDQIYPKDISLIKGRINYGFSDYDINNVNDSQKETRYNYRFLNSHKTITKNITNEQQDNSNNNYQQWSSMPYIASFNDLNDISEQKSNSPYSGIGFITLSNVIQTKSMGLNEIEGWAILCQAVQALQDMFLSDFPPAIRVLPYVKPSTIQITSKGRIVFNFIFENQLMDILNNKKSFFNNFTDHLPPEYLNNMNRKITFTESDMEKMWIYSLGLSLREAIKLSSIKNKHNTYKCDPCNDNNVEKECNNISLIDVLERMCIHKVQKRASLMYLLDVISSFCKNQNPVKPFSHIVMEIFYSTVTQLAVANSSIGFSSMTSETNQIVDCGKYEKQSETDSGTGSAYDEKDSAPPYNPVEKRRSCLKVRRPEQSKQIQETNYNHCNTIGYSGAKYLQNEKLNYNSTNQLQVVRRIKRNLASKDKQEFRRNTIDISLFDIEKAKNNNKFGIPSNFKTTKSMEYIDQISNGYDTYGTLLPDLCPQISKSIANLKAQQQSTKRIKDNIAMLKAYSDESFITKKTGPEFVQKPKIPPKQIFIVDSKCQHQKFLNVLLLNGKTIKIICNSVTTTRKILEAIYQLEKYVENYFIGLCAHIGGDFVFLPQDLKIYKVAPQVWINNNKKTPHIETPNFTLFIRIKFFLPNLRAISSAESKHLLYLQLRKSILERHISCSDSDLISLGGFALQAEIGDLKDAMKYHGEYFTISHYLPEDVYYRNKEIVKYLRNSHFCRQGLHQLEAEQNFIKYVQEMKEYGFHLYSAIWTTDDGNSIDVYVGISLGGMALFERNDIRQVTKTMLSKTSENCQRTSKISYQRKLYMNFEWLEIENLCYSKHILCIVVRKSQSLKAKDNNRIKYKLKMDSRKSYFAFCLASEHHQFYMKLRNSFISLKSLTAELNIPITSHDFEDKKSEIGSYSHQKEIKTIKTTANTITPPKLSSTSNSFNTKTTLSTFNNPNEMKKGILSATEKTISTKLKITNDTNTNSIEQQSHCNRLPPLPVSSLSSSSSINGKSFSSSSSSVENLAQKIDKQLKVSGLRVRNFKKSILNDNRLLRIRDRFLKRSKSTAGSIFSKIVTTSQQQQKANLLPLSTQTKTEAIKEDNDEKVKNLKKSKTEHEIQLKQTIETKDFYSSIGGKMCISKEENQNKENECPSVKVYQRDYCTATSDTDCDEYKNRMNLSPSPIPNDCSNKMIVYSPNRNRVKMGTRVFSSQFLNKSFDNIYDQHHGMLLNLCHFESLNSIDKESIESLQYNDGNCNSSSIDKIRLKDDDNNNRTRKDKINNNHQSLNNSHNSLHFIEKLSNNNKLYESMIVPSRPPSSLTEEAFVINSSIRSDRDFHYNNFTLTNETISESLLEKFNNISYDSNSNNNVNTNDRILMKLTVVKERLLGMETIETISEIMTQQTPQTVLCPLNSKSSCTCDLEFIEMKRDSCAKYATFSNRMFNEYYNMTNTNHRITENAQHYEINDGNHINNANDGRSSSNSSISSYINIMNRSHCGSSHSCDYIKTGISSNRKNKKYSNSIGGLHLPSSSKSQESIFIDNKFTTMKTTTVAEKAQKFMRENDDGSCYTKIQQTDGEQVEEDKVKNSKNISNDDLNGFTLGISVVQGTDNNVYVKDLIKNGPGDKAGIKIGDQIIAVNGVSLLHLSYNEALKKLQNTGLVVDLIVSQIFNENNHNDKIIRKSNDMISKDQTSCVSNLNSKYNNDNNNHHQQNQQLKKQEQPNQQQQLQQQQQQSRKYQENQQGQNLKIIKRTKSGIILPSSCHSISGSVENSNNKTSTHENIMYDVPKQIKFRTKTTDDICHVITSSSSSNDITKETLSKPNGTLTPAKSMPDLPKVVAIIPKRISITYPFNITTTTNNNNTCASHSRPIGTHSRKYMGPIRYPVTPFKTTILSPQKQQLSLLAESDDDQVYI